MNRVYLESGNVISSLGWENASHMERLWSARGGISICRNSSLSPTPFPASILPWDEVDLRFKALKSQVSCSRLEKLAILSLSTSLKNSSLLPDDENTILILSTTKGNVEELERGKDADPERLSLHASARRIAAHFGLRRSPFVVSNACISGVAAMILARELIRKGSCKHALLVGADVLSPFIVSGFQSFHSLSATACRPFDLQRNGLTLGEAAASLVMSADFGQFELLNGAISNDANHISGPSRTGEGLFRAITECLGNEPGKVDLVSAHGTATPYNDEMESIALDRAGLLKIPVNSLKGYFGHTLGAAGLAESILNLQALRENRMIPTLGYEESGVSRKINVCTRSEDVRMESLLKVASGFGGCNAAALFRKRK